MTPATLRNISARHGLDAGWAVRELGISRRTWYRWLAGESRIPTAAARLVTQLDGTELSLQA